MSSEKYYVGYTDDVDRRLDEHNLSEWVTYTSKHRPWVLKKSIVISPERSLAMRFEHAVKKSKSRKIIERTIAEVITLDELAQLVRVPICRD